ncbi:hypothetical protein HanHA300_Chr10g0344251 [Helianthus annuus]|nr:hypothetical protein HanHA300_Chr10g0344251 [Helianthus annuus]KAJ0528360.1 hypothetical protein HanHA89_Chr10g0365471 [Helianthus annuus]
MSGFLWKRSDPRKMAMPAMAIVKRSRLVDKSRGGGGGGLLAARSLSASRIDLKKTTFVRIRNSSKRFQLAWCRNYITK